MNSKPANNKPAAPLVKPFLKWAGGKGQLLETFRNFYPDELKSGLIKNYYEPFLGGGAVFFDVAQRFNIEQAFLFDVNEELILTYKAVQKEVEQLIANLQQLAVFYTALDEAAQKEFFYKVRDDFNNAGKKFNYTKFSKSWIERAAQIIFLNKTCFNGLFRFNSKGEFNVPAGRYKNPRILDRENLTNVSKLLEIACIRSADFSEFEQVVAKNSFVYFDPPYRPLSKTSSFTAYSKNRFDDLRQQELAQSYQRLDKKGVLQMLSNSDPKNINPADNFFDDLYKNFHLFLISAKRMINSKSSGRQPVNEIVVTNYPVKNIFKRKK